jgi:hypothetical protein
VIPSAWRYNPGKHLHSPLYYFLVPHVVVVIHSEMSTSFRSGGIQEEAHDPVVRGSFTGGYGELQLDAHVFPVF